MKSKIVYSVLASLLVSVFAVQANAHYLWVSIDKKSGKHGTTNVYFEEGPRPGDGSYLDPFFKRGKIWMLSPAKKPVALKINEINKKEQKKRWASADLTGDAPRAAESYFKFGVYQYGKTFVLLHYYAKYLDLSTHEDLHDLSRSKNLALDIIPHDNADEVELTVLWKGKPAAGRTVKIRGPKKFQSNVKTNKNGVVTFKPKEKGRYTFLTNVEQKEKGTFEEKDYSIIRHHSSLVMILPLEK